MLVRIKDKKEYDTITFNAAQEKMTSPSDDPLAEKEKKAFLKNVAFGIKSQRMAVYTHHHYECPLFFDTRFFSQQIIVEFLAGYYGVSTKDIIDFHLKKEGRIEFQIYENFQRIDDAERQGNMVFFKTTSEFFHERSSPWCEDPGKLIETEFVFENPLKEAQYKDIFNQLNIDRFGVRKITLVKYNEFIKGSVQYPFKLFTRLPYYPEQHLVVQFVSKYFITLVFHLRECRVKCTLVPETHTITEEEIMKEIWHFKFAWGKIQRVYKTYRLQFLYDGSLQTQLKKLQKLQQYEHVKTHGQQYLLKGYNTMGDDGDDLQRPQIKITFFPNQNNMQIQITALDNTNIALMNLTLIQNHFQLTQRDEIQFSTIQELQQLDPTEFGADDRYDYEKLVNDVRKRPIYKNLFSKEERFIKEEKENYELKPIIDKELNNLQNTMEIRTKSNNKPPPSGGAKGSSVYVNFKAYTDKEVEEFKQIQKELGQNAVIKNQTYFQGLFATFQCSPYYPYLNLSQTNGKDAISCVIDPLNLTGVSIFDFYDVARRLLDKEEYLAKIKKLIIGRVSISATKFTKWVVPGRCSELSVPLQKVFGSGNLMLSLIMIWSEEFNPSAFHTPETIDDVWFKSVFGAGYNELFDGEVYYNADEEKWYAKNKAARHPAVYIQYNTYNKYLVIKDDIQTVGSYHFYIPYQLQASFKVQTGHFSVEKYKKDGVKIDGYIKLNYNNTYFLVCEEGFLPFSGDIAQFKRLHPKEFIPPKLDFILKYCQLKQFDYFYINYHEKIIGGLINGMDVYWKEEVPAEFEKRVQNYELKLGTYPICDVQYKNARLGQIYTNLQTVCHIIAKEYYSQQQFKYIELTEENIMNIVEKYNQLGKPNVEDGSSLCMKVFPKPTIISGLKQLLDILPDTKEFQVPFIMQQALFYQGTELQYRKQFGEIIRIYKPTSKITEDL